MRTFLILIILAVSVQAQSLIKDDAVLKAIWKEANENSQLKQLAHELLDVVGPRLSGTPQMLKANDWAVSKFKSWGVSARNEKMGEWLGWERGITHIDLLEPRVRTLEGMLLAWSVGTPAAGITAGLVTFPDFKDEADFKKWLPSVKGKIVLVSEPEITGRPDYNWEEFATKESFEKMKEERSALGKKWRENIEKTGLPTRSRDGAKTLYDAIEEAGAAAVISSRWSNGFGVNKVFSTLTKKIPSFDVGMEDYGLIYRPYREWVKSPSTSKS